MFYNQLSCFWTHSLWWVPPCMAHCSQNTIWKLSSFVLNPMFQIQIPMNWAHLRCWKISLPCFCFQIHHSTSLRPAIEKHYLNGGVSTTEETVNLFIHWNSAGWPKYSCVTCWHFWWHLESPTSWDPCSLLSIEWQDAPANIVKSHGKSDCNNLRHVVDIHEIHNLLSTQWLSCRIHPTMMVILAEKTETTQEISSTSRLDLFEKVTCLRPKRPALAYHKNPSAGHSTSWLVLLCSAVQRHELSGYLLWPSPQASAQPVGATRLT